MLLATILTLGILEHWFLVVPLPVNAIWQWGLRSRLADRSDDDDAGLRSDFGRLPGRGVLRPRLATAETARRMARPIDEFGAPGVDVSMKRRPS